MEQKESKFTKSFLWKIIAIVTCAIMFIPMMYSLFYLGAFWDPYGSLKDVPIAFVNLDESYSKDGKDYTYGKDLEKKLKDNDSFKWEFVSYTKAKEGVDAASYYAMIVIPNDFSKKLANSTSGDFKKPQIIYRANKGRNYIFAQLSLKGAESLQNQITSNISKETSKVLVDKLYEVKDSLKDASDAQNKIQDGTQKLVDGSATLSLNLVTAFDGSNKIKTGLDSAVTGSSTLKSGLDRLFNGSIALNNGLNSAYSASTALSRLNELAEGQKGVVGGLNTLSNNLTQFKTAINTPGGDMDTLVNSSKAASNIAESLNDGVGTLNKAVSNNLETAASGVDNVNQGISSVDQLLQEAMSEISTDPAKAKQDMERAQNITATLKQNTPKISEELRANKNVVSDKLSTAAAGLKQYNAGIYAGTVKAQAQTSGTIDKFIGGIKPLYDGSSTIYTNLSGAASKTSDFANGLSQLSNGSKDLMTGLGTANNGAGQLESGLNTIDSSTGTLANGLGQLSDGSKTLNSSLGTLNDGTTKLKTGLNDGYSKLNDNLKFTSNDMSKFVSDPVKLSDQSINDVKKYGEGLAPYFISLSLWLGAMFVNIILTLIDKLKLTKNKFLNSFIGKFILGAALVSVQAIILALSLNAGLGLDAVNVAYLYLNNIFTSIVFFSVMYGLSAAFGIMSTPISFVLLILQLSSCGGTFPIETAPLFYRVVNKFIPMTYTVKIVRMILSGINHSGLMQNISILLAFMFTFLIGGFLIKTLREKISKQLISKQSAETAA